MSTLLKIVNWKPSTVSWLSFVFMGLIVAGVGLVGTAHVVNYLQLRLVDHGVEHNKEVALALIPKIEAVVSKDPADVLRILSQTIESYKSFGSQIFVLDRSNQSIAVDSKNFRISPIPIKESWLARATRLDGSAILLPQEIGSLSSLNADEHLMLIWLQEINIPEKGRWVLGVANDQETLIDFMGDLHWHLDAVMLLTYILITFLGYYAVRSIGRAYERRLESEIWDRTQALEAAHEEVLLKTRLATIGKTASVLTHEIRNPLSSIKLALSGLKSSVILEDREQRRVDLMLGEVDRLDGLLSETLDYVRPVKLSDSPVNIDQLFRTVLKQQEPLMEEKEIRLDHVGCTDCSSMRVDVSQIHQVFLNIIKNAIEASPLGGEVSTSLQREGDDLIVEINNQSETLDEDIVQRAFEPFFTTKPKGTGLGLGLVKRVVEEHGGMVTLASNLENRTRLTLSLPMTFS